MEKENAKKNKLEILHNILLFFLTIIIFFSVCEAISRAYYKPKIFDGSVWPELYKANVDINSSYVNKENGITYNINDNSINEDAYVCFDKTKIKKDKPKGVKRIVVMGDSYTWGSGVSSIKDTFTSQLQGLFDKKNQKIEILPFAKGGLNTFQEYLVLKDVAMSYDPDYIVLQHCPNDNDPARIELDNKGKFIFAKTNVVYIGKEIIPAFPLISMGVNKVLLEKSYFLRFLSSRINSILINNPGSYQNNFEYIKKINLLVKEKNIPFVVIELPPANYNICKDELLKRYFGSLAQEMGNNNIRFFNLCDYVEDISKLNSGKTNDIHYGKQGYQLVAEILFKEIENNLK